MADGQVVYEIRGDDSQLDKDLNSAEKKIKQSSSQASNSQQADFKETAREFKTQSDNIVQDAKNAGSQIEQSSE